MSQFRRALPHFCASFLRLSAVALLTFAQSTASNAQVAPTLAEKLAAPRPIAAVTSPWLDELTWMEVRDLIAAGTTTVGDVCRRAFLLREVENMSYEEIGRVLGCGQKTLSTRLHRARQALRDLML